MSFKEEIKAAHPLQNVFYVRATFMKEKEGLSHGGDDMETILMPRIRLARTKLEGNPRKRLRKLSQQREKSGSNLRMSPWGVGSIPKTRIQPSNLFRFPPLWQRAGGT